MKNDHEFERNSSVYTGVVHKILKCEEIGKRSYFKYTLLSADIFPEREKY